MEKGFAEDIIVLLDLADVPPSLSQEIRVVSLQRLQGCQLRCVGTTIDHSIVWGSLQLVLCDVTPQTAVVPYTC